MLRTACVVLTFVCVVLLGCANRGAGTHVAAKVESSHTDQGATGQAVGAESGPTAEIRAADVAGVYQSFGAIHDPLTVTLRSDGRFEFARAGCFGEYARASGRWALEAGRVILHVEEIEDGAERMVPRAFDLARRDHGLELTPHLWRDDVGEYMPAPALALWRYTGVARADASASP